MWDMGSINQTLKRLVRHLRQHGQAPAGEILRHSAQATLIRFAGEDYLVTGDRRLAVRRPTPRNITCWFGGGAPEADHEE